MRPTDMKNDDWLGRIMKRAVFRLGPGSIKPEDLAALPPDSFVYCKVPAGEIDRINLLEGMGFRLADTSIVFYGHPGFGAGSGDGLEIRMAVPDDAEQVAELAGNCFVHSRFHADPYIENVTADAIKFEWARNYFKGQRGDAMVVGCAGSKIVGFLQLIYQDGSLVIDLVGVSPSRQRRGLARGMIAFAWQHCGCFETISVGTQAANGPAIKCYQSLGLLVKDISHSFHWHHCGGV